MRIVPILERSAQDKWRARSEVCWVFVEVRKQAQGMKRSLPFGTPMMWREPGNHTDDCYLCS
jgi:hypothetical protein